MKQQPRIVSFLPAATEMIFALGLGKQVVGISHECDFPPEARSKPAVVKPVLPLERMSLREIDVAVSERLRNGQSLYQVDEKLLADLKPDLIVTQNLCQVCAPSGNDLTAAVQALRPPPEVLFLTPHSLEDVFQNILSVGQVAGAEQEGITLASSARQRLQNISDRSKAQPRPRVFFMEWADPVYNGGHWVPEMIELAGGHDSLASRGVDSYRIQWDEVLRWQPEVLIFSPCGFHVDAAMQQVPMLQKLPQWDDLPAVKAGRVYAVDANAYFARPGPRLVEGTELLAHLFHPEIFSWSGPAGAYRKIGK
jgi:iron complex transport system substrate-binding protein